MPAKGKKRTPPRRATRSGRKADVSKKSPRSQSGERSKPLTPGWTAAHPDMFKLPKSPSPTRSRRVTRRSSVFHKVTTGGKVVGTVLASEISESFTADFKTAGGSKRRSMYQKTQVMSTALSPALTRSRRASFIQRSPKQAIKSRIPSPPKKVAVRKVVAKPAQVKNESDEDNEGTEDDSEVTFNFRGQSKASKIPKPPAVKQTEKKVSPAKQRKALPSHKKSLKRRSQDSSPTEASPTKKVRTPSPTKKLRTPSPTKKVRTPSPTKKVPTASPTKKVRIPSPTKKVPTASPTKKVRTPSPTQRKTHRVTPSRNKSLKRSPVKSKSPRKLVKSKSPRKISPTKKVSPQKKASPSKGVTQKRKITQESTATTSPSKRARSASASPRRSRSLKKPKKSPRLAIVPTPVKVGEKVNVSSSKHSPKLDSPQQIVKMTEIKVKTKTPEQKESKSPARVSKSAKKVLTKSSTPKVVKLTKSPRSTPRARQQTPGRLRTPSRTKTPVRGRSPKKVASVTKKVLKVTTFVTPSPEAVSPGPKKLPKKLTPGRSMTRTPLRTSSTPPKAARLLGKTPGGTPIKAARILGKTPGGTPVKAARLLGKTPLQTPMTIMTRSRTPPRFSTPMSEVHLKTASTTSSVLVSKRTTNTSNNANTWAYEESVDGGHDDADDTDAGNDYNSEMETTGMEIAEKKPDRWSWWSWCTIL